MPCELRIDTTLGTEPSFALGGPTTPRHRPEAQSRLQLRRFPVRTPSPSAMPAPGSGVGDWTGTSGGAVREQTSPLGGVLVRSCLGIQAGCCFGEVPHQTRASLGGGWRPAHWRPLGATCGSGLRGHASVLSHAA